jgi:ribose transport system ATP-binding protein
VASSELPELIGLCDRIIVMRQGCAIAEFSGGVDERILLESATGIAEVAA